MKRPGIVAAMAAGAICSAAAVAAATDDPGRGGSAMARAPSPRAVPAAPPAASPVIRRRRSAVAARRKAASDSRAEREASRPARKKRRARPSRRARAATAAPPPRTVLGSIRRARSAGRIGRGDAHAYTRRWQDAHRALRLLGGVRAAELGAVVRGTERLAASGRLSAGRMPAVFLEVVRNTRFWSRRGPPDAGRRFTFARDPVILQYYPGQGLRIQPLASAGEANSLFNACRGYKTRPGTPCRRRALGRLLDRLVELAARRGGFTAWEYYFAFAGGQAPWISGMAQGTVIQALARGHRLLGRQAYLDAARDALGAFEAPAPTGVAVAAEGGTHYAMYSQSPGLQVLNGFLQAVAGLQTYARVSGERRAWRLFRAGDRAAQRTVPGYDTGGWSLYSKPGGESTLEYHRLVRDFLGNLCRRDAGRVYCRTERRFTDYLERPPRLNLRPIRGARSGRPVRVRFRLSRSALVTVMVRSNGGRTVFRRSLRLVRGAHEVRWTPRSGRDYRVHASARDARGKRSRRVRVARVR